MYTLIDTFNNKTLSNHRTLGAAAAAQRKHAAAVSRANGAGSYLTYTVRHADGRSLTEAEYDDYQESRFQAEADAYR